MFEDGLLTHAGVIPVGGDHITKDLSIVLKTPTEQAEKIKKQYGHAFYDDASDEQLFEVPVVGTDLTDQYSQRYIAEIIGVRLEELFELVLDELARIGYSGFTRWCRDYRWCCPVRRYCAISASSITNTCSYLYTRLYWCS